MDGNESKGMGVMKKRICLSLALILFWGKVVVAQQGVDARGAGMGFSNAADTRGLEQVGLNPATLALPHEFNFEFNLMSANAGVFNNSFERNFYDTYFTTGERLTDNDKALLLGAIPQSGLESRFSARVHTLALYMPRFSLALSGVGDGYATVPREVFEIALNGNRDLGREYDLSNVEGSAWGGIQVSSGFAYPLSFGVDSWLDFLAIGVSGKYVVGMGYFEVLNSEGVFRNTDQTGAEMSLDAQIEARTARGGQGWAADLGVVTQSKDRSLTFSAAISNVLGSVNWETETEGVLFSFDGDSIALGDSDADSLVLSEDSTYAINAFSSRLPVTFDVGVAYQALSRLLVTAQYEQSFGDNMGIRPFTRFAFGTELKYIPFIPLRAGFSVGGRYGTSYAVGTGLDLKFWYIDVGVINHGGVSASASKGLTVSATTRFRF